MQLLGKSTSTDSIFTQFWTLATTSASSTSSTKSGNPLLMKEEDVGRASASHDPHQPAHVHSPGSEFPQVQPAHSTSTETPVSVTHSTLWSCKTLMVMLLEDTHITCSPGCIRCSYKEIYHHPVAHVESLLHLPVTARECFKIKISLFFL